jgi:ParB family chromosome partitioning protein
LSDDVKQRLVSESLTERHARALLKIEDEKDQVRVIDEIVTKGLNVKRTEELIEKEIILSKAKNDIKETVKPNKSKNFKWSISPKIITNTIKQIMEKNGIKAEYQAKEKEEYMEIIVRIPKM